MLKSRGKSCKKKNKPKKKKKHQKKTKKNMMINFDGKLTCIQNTVGPAFREKRSGCRGERREREGGGVMVKSSLCSYVTDSATGVVSRSAY